MIEKPLIIMIFMYSISFSLLGGQYMLSTFGVEMVNPQGVPIRSNLLLIVESNNLNSITAQLVNLNGTATQINPVVAAAGLVIEVLQLLTGTYIFSIMYIFGVPAIFVYGFTTLYAIMLFRTLIAYLRGV